MPKLLQRDDYYPFGLKFNSSTTGPENKFTYNGKELEDEHGLNWYHYGARFYDLQLGRWHVTDPAEEFHTPFGYVGNNPIIKVDPDGASSENSNCCPDFEYTVRYLFQNHDESYLGDLFRSDSYGLLEEKLTADSFDLAIAATDLAGDGFDYFEDAMYLAAPFSEGATIPLAIVSGRIATGLAFTEAGLEYAKADALNMELDSFYAKSREAVSGVIIDKTVKKFSNSLFKHFQNHPKEIH